VCSTFLLRGEVIFSIPVRCGMVFLTAVTIFASCGNKTDAQTSPLEFDGLWSISECSEKEASRWSTRILTLTSGLASFKTIEYDDDCKVEQQIIEAVGTATTGNLVDNPPAAREYVIQINKLIYNLKMDRLVDKFNSPGAGPPICGGGFVKNTPKELTAADCANSLLFRDSFKGVFNIYKLETNSLYLGNCSASGSDQDCSEPAKRPKSMASKPLTRI